MFFCFADTYSELPQPSDRCAGADGAGHDHNDVSSKVLVVQGQLIMMTSQDQVVMKQARLAVMMRKRV